MDKKYERLAAKAQRGEEINALLLYPKNLKGTYWGYEYALPIVGKSASSPPLGLITIPGFFPPNYKFRLVDMNVSDLRDEQIEGSDVVLPSSMVAQAGSLEGVVRRANEKGVPVILGGSNPTEYYDKIKGDAIFVLNEGEQTIPLLVSDLRRGKIKRVYARPSNEKQLSELYDYFRDCGDTDIAIEREKPELTRTPPARFDLVSMKDYQSMIIQLSRGCPNGCEFCNVRTLFGGKTRYKPVDTTLTELDSLYKLGWRRSVFVADDNTIANKNLALERFKAIAEWQKKHGYPFQFGTELSINFADNPDLLSGFVEMGGNFGFIGFETPNVRSLVECEKWVNLRELMEREGLSREDMKNISDEREDYLTGRLIDLTVEKTRKILRAGVEIFGGHVYGFDGDNEKTIDRQIELIQRCGIATAMTGTLNALRGTPMYERMKRGGRIIGDSDGNNTHRFSTNFVTQIDSEIFRKEYGRWLGTLYDDKLKNFFERSQTMLDNLGENPHFARRVRLDEILTLFRSSRILAQPYGWNYAKFLMKNLFYNPGKFSEAVRLGITGHHFRQITKRSLLEEGLA